MTRRGLLALALLLGCVTGRARAAAEAPPLVTLAERTEDGKLVPYPSSSVVDVDVNSAVRLQLSPQALASLSGDQATADRAALAKALKDLAAIQKDLNATMRALVAAERTRTEALAGGAALSETALTRYRDAHSQLLKIYKKLDAYMGEARRAVLVTAASDADEDQPTAHLRFVAEEHRRLQARVQEDLEDSPPRFLTITAEIGDPPRQLHVPGYDDLKAGSARALDKTRFTFDEEFAEEYATAQVLAREAADWDRLREAALSAVRGRIAEIQAKLEEVARQAEALQKQAAKEVAPEVKAIVGDLKEAADELTKARDETAKALGAALRPGSANPAQLVADAVGALQKVAGRVERAAKILLETVPKIQGAAGTFAASATKLANQVAELVTGTFASVFIASKPAIAAPAPTALRIRLAAARDTEFSLLTSDRKDGDVVKITTRVFDTGPEGDTPVVGGEHTRYLRVRSRGLVADTGAVVLFTRPLKRNPGPFVPAAGAFAVFRFKGYRSADQANSTFWYYTAPGLGVAAIAIPRSSDGSTQIAWMGTFHLFGDILQASLGTTTDASPVWGIGIGLHRIAGFGKYFQ